MSSSTDFKQLFDKYQSEGVPNGLSIVKYCQMNGVVYSQFERWYKKCRADVVVPVQVTHHNLSYQGLCPMTEKLEVLCYR